MSAREGREECVGYGRERPLQEFEVYVKRQVKWGVLQMISIVRGDAYIQEEKLAHNYTVTKGGRQLGGNPALSAFTRLS